MTTADKANMQLCPSLSISAKSYLDDTVPVDLLAPHLRWESPFQPHPEIAVLDWDLVTVEASELILILKKPVWDYLSFVKWCIILLEVAIRRWSTVVIKGWTWSATILRYSVVFQQFPVGAKGNQVCEEHTSHTITPPAAAWPVDTSQDGSILSYCLCQLLTLPSECSRFIKPGNVFSIFYCSISVSLCEV